MAIRKRPKHMRQICDLLLKTEGWNSLSDNQVPLIDNSSKSWIQRWGICQLVSIGFADFGWSYAFQLCKKTPQRPQNLKAVAGFRFESAEPFQHFEMLFSYLTEESDLFRLLGFCMTNQRIRERDRE